MLKSLREVHHSVELLKPVVDSPSIYESSDSIQDKETLRELDKFAEI